MRLMISGSFVTLAGLLESSTVLPVKVEGASATRGAGVPGLARMLATGFAGAGVLPGDVLEVTRGGGLLILGAGEVCLENQCAGPEEEGGGVAADSASCFARSASKNGNRGWVGAICCRAAISVRAAL